MKKRMLVLFLSSMLTILMTGCVISMNGLSFGGISSYDYADADSYTMGGAELDELIDELTISWVSGSVTVAYHDKPTVAFTETANEETDEKTTLYYRLKDGRLTIHFAKSGRVNLTGLSKNLTVYLPAGSSLEELSLSLVSSEAEITAATSDAITLDTVSGNVNLVGCVCSDLKVNTVSGAIAIAASGEIASLDANTVSGDVTVCADSIGDAEVNTVSGDVSLSAKAAPTELDFDATSGDLTLLLPSDVGLTVEFDTVSGKLHAEQAVTTGKNHRYVFGDGAGQCECKSVSGDLFLRKLAEE